MFKMCIINNLLLEYLLIHSNNCKLFQRSSEREDEVQESKRLKSWCDICKKQFSSASSLAVSLQVFAIKITFWRWWCIYIYC